MADLDEIKENLLKKGSERFLAVSDNFLSALDVISETPTGKRLIRQISPFEIILNDSPIPYISLMSENVIFFPSDYSVDGTPDFYIRSLSHEMKHLVQKNNNLLPLAHTKKGSLREFFIEEKLAEANAETTSDLIFYESLGKPKGETEKQKYMSMGKSAYFRKKSADMIRGLLSPFSGNWETVYRRQALQHVSHIALYFPERLVKEGREKRHKAVLEKYAKEYTPFLSADDLDIMTPDDKKSLKKLEKICSSGKKLLIRKFILDVQNERI